MPKRSCEIHLKGAQRELTVEGIQKTICDYYNIKLGDLKAKRRTKNIAFRSQVAMYLCRKYTETSFPAIGDKFGGRDHSTVIHASKTIEKKIKEDPYMQTTIESSNGTLTSRNSCEYPVGIDGMSKCGNVVAKDSLTVLVAITGKNHQSKSTEQEFIFKRNFDFSHLSTASTTTPSLF